MAGVFDPKIMLNVSEDETASYGFEPASRNVVYIKPFHCPQCLNPMGIKGQKRATIKVWTAQGISYWCEQCVEKGVEEKTCIKYRSFSKKERKQLKKIERGKYAN